MPDPGGPTALVVAHPGHELTLHGWVEATRPVVFVLTDGSGQLGAPRITSTTRLLDAVGAGRGAVFGRFSDGDVYAALLARNGDAFTGVARELAGWLVQNPVRDLVTDSSEGYNPTHDLCRTIAGVAATLAAHSLGRAVPLYEYVVTGDRGACLEGRCTGAIRARLGDGALARKLRAASEYTELAAETRLSIERDGGEAYRVECLHPIAPALARPSPPSGTPYYERHGEARVESAKYERVIRYREHVRPVEDALWELADSSLPAGRV